jgi:hypothetical protein
MWSELDHEAPAREEVGGPRPVEEIAQIVVMERLHCYNHDLPCGASALRIRLRDQGVQPLPSVKWIGQALTRYGLTHGRTGWYQGEELDWLPKSAQRRRVDRPPEGTQNNGSDDRA